MLWLLGSIAFTLYTSNWGKYNQTYGALAGVIVLMFWLFLSAFAILFGAELNAEMERQTKKDTTAGHAQPMGRRQAHAADTLGASTGR